MNFDFVCTIKCYIKCQCTASADEQSPAQRELSGGGPEVFVGGLKARAPRPPRDLSEDEKNDVQSLRILQNT